MVVDDNHDAAELLAVLLETCGHDVRTAHDARTALEVAASFVPDVALLDLGLPGMDGWELAGRLRELPELAHLRLVALSGYREDVERSRRAGFEGYLLKPADIGDIEAIVARG